VTYCVCRKEILGRGGCTLWFMNLVLSFIETSCERIKSNVSCQSASQSVWIGYNQEKLSGSRPQNVPQAVVRKFKM
jgi:hypothetical protein